MVSIGGTIAAKRGRPPSGDVAMTGAMRKKKFDKIKSENRLKHLAVLDMETDPFSDDRKPIFPFTAEIYSDQFGSIVIWEDHFDIFVDKLYTAIVSLPDSYIIYAHNGGKFDFMFLISKLRGNVKFKGRSIMSAKIGNHELRDSLHILPEKLAAWKKDKFDYSKLTKKNRHKYRDEILKYQHSDCIYLFDFIKRFTKEFGLKISIGSAAFTELKKHYRIAPIKEKMDFALRPYFLGGRVECIAGAGLFDSASGKTPYRLFDVNSMYPYVMAAYKHPVSAEYMWHRGSPTDNTVFIDLSCKSYGAFFQRSDLGDLNASECEGRFFTTIWEYRTAERLGLIENIEIHWCVDNQTLTDFSKFVVPMYERRQQCKVILEANALPETELEEIKKESIFLKYLLNNAYGKCAQNPRNYKDFYYTDHGEKPPKDWFEFMIGADDETIHRYGFPVERSQQFDVWARPAPGTRFNNVGTAASITGAARAILLEAKTKALDPIYCDTDSLICRDIPGVDIDIGRLGSWKIEDTFDRVIVAGKKTYCCEVAGHADGHEKRLKVRSKGTDLRVKAEGISQSAANQATWDRYVAILRGDIVEIVNTAPTFSKTGEQHFMSRRIRATARDRKTGLDHVNRITPGVAHGARKLSVNR